ncbi:MAG: DUF3021 family protein [Clostridia bacterium]|nr:DUF3021 family protein [Clostridia bacterium]
MKRFENILLKGCGFAVLILTLFYIFALTSNYNNATIEFSTFALILAFGMLISFTTMLLGLKKLALPLRIAIHYTSLMVAFCIIFMASGNISADSPAKIFSAVVIFTFLYAMLFGAVYFIKKLVNAVDNKVDKRSKKNTEKKSEYKSLYSSKQ